MAAASNDLLGDTTVALAQLRGVVAAARRGDDEAMQRALGFADAVDDGSPTRIAASAGVSVEGARTQPARTGTGSNPLLDRLWAEQRWVAAQATSEAPPPELFGRRAMPIATASGLPLDLLEQAPALARPAIATAPTRAAAVAILQAVVDPVDGEQLAAAIAAGQGEPEAASELIGPCADVAGVIAGIRAGRAVCEQYRSSFDAWARGTTAPPAGLHAIDHEPLTDSEAREILETEAPLVLAAEERNAADPRLHPHDDGPEA